VGPRFRGDDSKSAYSFGPSSELPAL
jgi:hypothetical protein